MSTDERPAWVPGRGKTTNRCQNCDSHVHPRTILVYGTNGGVLHHCHNCEGIFYRDLRHGAGCDPEYDPETDRERNLTSDNHPIYLEVDDE